MRTLVISAANGCFVTLRQLGSGAEETDVRAGCRVIVHFVNGRPARKPGEYGSLWAYEDSLIQTLYDVDTHIPTLGHEVFISSE